MSDEIVKVEERHIPDVLAELESAFFDIPFENSDYQNKAFVMASQQTPARAYRAIGLRMFAKIRAIKEYLYNIEISKIDIEEKLSQIQSPETNDYQKRRLRLEIARIEEGKSWGEKLYNDALRELSCLYTEFKKYPTYTREQFEAEEVVHFQKKLERQIQSPGPHESLANMHQDLPNWDKQLEIVTAHLLEMSKNPALKMVK